MQEKLEESKKETEAATTDFGKLKDRARGVAGELKEKRAECRTLSSEIALLGSTNDALRERITRLEAKGMDMNQSSEETKGRLESLRAALGEKTSELERARDSLEREKKKAEESLGAYKKKAQQSLALANARSASAIQAREEAEMEARAARATADSAMTKAVKSEINGKQALAEARVYVEEMKGEVASHEAVKEELRESRAELEKSRSEAETHRDSSEKLRCELASLSCKLEAERATMEGLRESLSTEQNRCHELYDEVERLRGEGRNHRDEIRRLSEARRNESNPSSSSFSSPGEAEAVVPGMSAEAEATIAMLRQELKDSNRAIKDLKETLRATMEETADAGGGLSVHQHHNTNNNNNSSSSNTSNGSSHPSENGMPLFYAMEKQAELTQARDEIARMANLLGDAESTKQEALDEMHDMRRLMEDAQSRLKRQEQLRKGPEEDKSLNVEYLKNIVLSYLNAGTVREKKALLPVIGTVLCLTHDEQARAIEQLEKGGGSAVTSVLGLWS